MAGSNGGSASNDVATTKTKKRSSWGRMIQNRRGASSTGSTAMQAQAVDQPVPATVGDDVPSDQSLSLPACATTIGCQLCSLVDQIGTFMPFMDRVDEARELWVEARRSCGVLCTLLFDHQPANPIGADDDSRSGGIQVPGCSAMGASTPAQKTTSHQPLSRPPTVTPKLRTGITKDWRDTERTLKEIVVAALSRSFRQYDLTNSYPEFSSIFTDKALRVSFISRLLQATASSSSSSSPAPSPNLRAFIDEVVGPAFEPYDRLESVLDRMFSLLLVVDDNRGTGNAQIASDRRQNLRAQVSGSSSPSSSSSSASRTVQETVISMRGDAVLEFANQQDPNLPVYRFRVQSSMLAEISPVFARLFSEQAGRPLEESEAGIVSDFASTGASSSQPFVSPSRRFSGAMMGGNDKTSVPRVYEMAQTETNSRQAVTIMLHAAHMHNDLVPRDVDFEQFVAIAEACHRYACTSPLELVVEHRWLPAWQHRAHSLKEDGQDSVPEGFLIISHAFGLRRIFTAVSKKAILHVEDEEQGGRWPLEVRARVWAVRQAKMDQVLDCCSSMLSEFLRSPLADDPQEASARLFGRGSVAQGLGEPTSSVGTVQANATTKTSATRCPHGSYACDASNLGWFMMVLAQLQILPQIMQSPALRNLPQPPMKRSLNKLVDSLRCVSGPPMALASEGKDAGSVGGSNAGMVTHGGVCDFAYIFRSAIYDIYNSVQGLTLFDVSGKHGWALSKHKVDEPQAVHRFRSSVAPSMLVASSGMESPVLTPAGKGTTGLENAESLKQHDLTVQRRILGELDDLRDLHAVAMVNRSFYKAYQKHELELMRGIVRRDDKRRRSSLVPGTFVNIAQKQGSLAAADISSCRRPPDIDESKVLLDGPGIKGPMLRNQTTTWLDEEEEEEEDDYDETEDDVGSDADNDGGEEHDHELSRTTSVTSPASTPDVFGRSSGQQQQQRQSYHSFNAATRSCRNSNGSVAAENNYSLRRQSDNGGVSLSTKSQPRYSFVGEGGGGNATEGQQLLDVMEQLRLMGQDDSGGGGGVVMGIETEKFVSGASAAREDKMRSPDENKHLRATYDRLVGVPSGASG